MPGSVTRDLQKFQQDADTNASVPPQETAKRMWDYVGREIWPKLLGILRSQYGNRVPEDVINEAVLAFYQLLTNDKCPDWVRKRGHIDALVILIVRRKASNWARDHRKEQPLYVRNDSDPQGSCDLLESCVGVDAPPDMSCLVEEEIGYCRGILAAQPEQGSPTLVEVFDLMLEGFSTSDRPRGYTIPQMAELLEVSERTVFRKLKLIRTILQGEDTDQGADS